MSKAKRVRWECPNGHPAVLGPQRPRRDNVVRYCLKCSEREGRLVERTAPSVERERERGRERSRARAQARAERQREAERKEYTVRVKDGDDWSDLDMREVHDRIMALPSVRERANELVLDLTGARPGGLVPWVGSSIPFTIRRRPGAWTSGHAWSGGRVVMTVGPVRRERAEALFLHEVAHVLCLSDEWHGPNWRKLFVRMAHEYWPGIRLHASHQAQEITDEAARAAREGKLAGRIRT